MKTGEEVARARGLKFEEYDGGVPAEAFAKVGLPLIVRCAGCQETMAFPTALVDDEGRTWCDDCAGEEPENPMQAFVVELVRSLSIDERKAVFESPEWLAIDESKRRGFLETLEKAGSSVRG